MADELAPLAFINGVDTKAAQMFTLAHELARPGARPRLRNVDLALIRRVPMAESTALELCAEVFHLTNTPPLGAPNGVFGSAAFGTIISAGDPRVIRLAIKDVF